MPIDYSSVQEYGRLFTDVNVWRQAVEQVAQRHQLAATTIQAGLAGTHPTFRFGDEGQQHFLKFYETRLFTGARSYRIERALYQNLLVGLPLAIPQLVASGTLQSDGSWPYIITTVIPGQSFGEVRARVSQPDTLAIATVLGQTIRQLHHIPVGQTPILGELQQEFRHYIDRRYAQCVADHRRWNTLPSHLLEQIPAYLAAQPRLNTETEAALIHADLTHDHLLGEWHADHWQPTGLIDFGDAWVGDPIYELVALHLSLFQLDKSLLKPFLHAYGVDPALPTHFVERAMVATLLFEFNPFGPIAEHRPDLLTATTLEEMAFQLWDVTAV